MKIKTKKRKLGFISIITSIMVFALFLLFNNIILVLPYGVTYDRSPSFEWVGFEKNYVILIDDDPNFKNPLYEIAVNGNRYQHKDNLEFGKYYWKVISNNKESIIGSFIVDSIIKIETDGKIRNKGNSPVFISGITGGAVLDIEGEIEIDEEGEYRIEQA